MQVSQMTVTCCCYLPTSRHFSCLCSFCSSAHVLSCAQVVLCSLLRALLRALLCSLLPALPVGSLPLFPGGGADGAHQKLLFIQISAHDGGAQVLMCPLACSLLCAPFRSSFQVKEQMELTKCARERFGKFFFRFPEGVSCRCVRQSHWYVLSTFSPLLRTHVLNPCSQPKFFFPLPRWAVSRGSVRQSHWYAPLQRMLSTHALSLGPRLIF